MLVYVPTPISELPKKEGYYHTIGKCMECYYHADLKKFDDEGEEITHWLKPVELSDIIEDKAKFFKDGLNLKIIASKYLNHATT